MSGLQNEYQQTLETLNHEDKHWTQFELDLIDCIRDDHPVIYTNTGDMTKHQRAGKIKSAWKKISGRFPELTVPQLKSKWRSILDNYLKVKIFDGSYSEYNETVSTSKYMNGSLKFLEGVNIDLSTSAYAETSNNLGTGSYSTYKNDHKEANPSYCVDIRELLHEEVDLDDELVIKEEVTEDTNITDVTFAVDTVEVKEEPIKKYTEEELMNATRLTKEMIDELILIKTRHYYMTPVTETK